MSRSAKAYSFVAVELSTLKGKSRNITKHLISGSTGYQLVFFFLSSPGVSRDEVVGHIRTLGKTNLLFSSGSDIKRILFHVSCSFRPFLKR